MVRSNVNQYQKLYLVRDTMLILALSALSTNSNFALVLALFWCYPAVGPTCVPSCVSPSPAAVSVQVLF
jgi:hypothetical protein